MPIKVLGHKERDCKDTDCVIDGYDVHDGAASQLDSNLPARRRQVTGRGSGTQNRPSLSNFIVLTQVRYD